MMTDELAGWVLAIATAGLLLTAVLTAWIGLRQLRIALTQLRVGLTQLRTSATTDLFHRFNQQAARDQRRWVYQNARGLIDNERLPTWANNAEHLRPLEDVCNSLDWAGLLVRKGLLNKQDAIDLYGDSLIRSWVALQRWITYTRQRRSSPEWLWSHFEWLAREAAKEDRFSIWISEGVPVYTPHETYFFDFETSEVKWVGPAT